MLRSGQVLVGGSNPHALYRFRGVLFPTDLSLEAYSPPYLDPSFAHLRPNIISPISQSKFKYGQELAIRFTIPLGRLNATSVMVTMLAPSFTTHSFSMNQRLLLLRSGDVIPVAKSTYQVRVGLPGSVSVAPPGYYMMFVVHQGIPSQGIWVQLT